jgi:hypothetical protein
VTIKDAPYLGIAEPIEDSEVARAYWQTVASVADIGKAIGITWARTVKDEAGSPARSEQSASPLPRVQSRQRRVG